MGIFSGTCVVVVSQIKMEYAIQDPRDFLIHYDSKRDTEEQILQALNELNTIYACDVYFTRHLEIVNLLQIFRKYKTNIQHPLFKVTFRICTICVNRYRRLMFSLGFLDDVIELLHLHGQTDLFVAIYGCSALGEWTTESFFVKECKRRYVDVTDVKDNPSKEYLLNQLLGKQKRCCCSLF